MINGIIGRKKGMTQVFDEDGGFLTLIPKPQEDQPLVSCAAAGEWLFVCNGDQVHRRPLPPAPEE